nr:hypothetical protein Iba_chr10dCG10250 [Ipomoea batatas]
MKETGRTSNGNGGMEESRREASERRGRRLLATIDQGEAMNEEGGQREDLNMK